MMSKCCALCNLGERLAGELRRSIIHDPPAKSGLPKLVSGHQLLGTCAIAKITPSHPGERMPRDAVTKLSLLTQTLKSRSHYAIRISDQCRTNPYVEQASIQNRSFCRTSPY